MIFIFSFFFLGWLTGCGVAKEMFLEQSKAKITQLQEENAKLRKRSQAEVKHYHDTAYKWKNRMLGLQSKVEQCQTCCLHVEDYNKN